MTLLANADVAEAKMAVDHPTSKLHAKCERCGQTGPTVPMAPVVFRGRPEDDVEVPHGPGSASLGTAARDVRPISTLPVRDEFLLEPARPAVGAAVTR